jgi:hypothetical protein
MWDDLRKTAMVGTDKATLAAATDEPQLEALVRGLASTDPTYAVLGTAGMLTVREMAGYRVRANGIQLPALAPDAERPVCSSGASGLLRAALAEKDETLVLLWVDTCLAAGQRPPDVLLPSLMLFAHTDISKWEAVSRLVGARGRWLAREFDHKSGGQVVLRRLTGDFTADDWWAACDARMIVPTFEAYRFWHPALARDLLEQTFIKRRPGSSDRWRMVSAMEINLSADDERLLELLLKDVAKSVGEASADMLARLPGSSYVARMFALAEGMVVLEEEPTNFSQRMTGEKVYSLKLKTHKNIADAVKRNRLGRGGVYGLDQESLWMYDIIRTLPPTYWEERFGLSTTETVKIIMQSAASHPQNNYLYEGVRAAMVNHHAVPWARAWLQLMIVSSQKLPVQTQTEQKLAEVAGKTWVETQVSTWFQAFLRKPDPGQLYILWSWLGLVPGPWREGFSLELIGFVEALLRDDKMRAVMSLPPIVGNRLHPSVVDDAYRRWTAITNQHSNLYHFATHLDTVLMTVKRRQAILEAFEG